VTRDSHSTGSTSRVSVCPCKTGPTDTQTDRQTYRETVTALEAPLVPVLVLVRQVLQTHRQTDRQTDIQKNSHSTGNTSRASACPCKTGPTDRQIDTQTYRH